MRLSRITPLYALLTSGILAALVAVLLPMVAAGLPTASAHADGQARLRAVHAVPDFGPVDVYVDGALTLEDVPFFTVSDYLEVPAGTYRVQVVAAGTPLSDHEFVLNDDFTVEAGMDYSLVVRGALSEHNIGATVLVDDNSAPAMGQAKLRAAHFSPDAPPVDIYVDGALTIEDLAFREATGYLEVPAGTYEIGIAPADGAVIFTTSATVEAGQVVTAWANGLLGGTPAFTVTPTIDAEFGAGDTFRLRAVHAVPDIAGNPVDVFVDGELVTTFDFFDATDYLTLFAGTYDIRVALAGEGPENAVIQADVPFEAGKDYSVVARGTADPSDAAELGATVLEDDNSAPTPGLAKLRAAHFSPDAPPVDIYVDGALTIEDLAFREATGYLEVPAGSYEVGIAPAGGDVIFTTSATVEEGQVVTAWANGLLGGSDAQAFKVTPTIDAEFGASFRLRAVHAVPDIAGNPVDVFVDGELVATFDFFDATDYLTLFAGTYDIRVALAGEGPENAVIQADVPFEAGKDYSVVARGTADPSDAAELGATVLEDDNSAPGFGLAKLRAAHFSPDAPPVDIYVDGALTIENLSYREATGYLEVPAGTYELGIAPAGGDVIFTTSATVEAGQVVTAWANGLLSGSGAQAFKVTPTLDAVYELAQVRVLNTSATTSVDVYVADELVASDVAPGALTSYTTIEAGSVTVKVTAAGSDELLGEAELTLGNGEQFTLAIVFATTPAPAASVQVVVLQDNNARPGEGQARLRLAHLAPEAPTVDLRSGGSVLLDDVSFGSAPYADVEPGLVEATVTTADGSSEVLRSELLLLPGSVTSVFVLSSAEIGGIEAAPRVLVAIDLQAENTIYLPIVAR